MNGKAIAKQYNLPLEFFDLSVPINTIKKMKESDSGDLKEFLGP
jgi:hypothetical protein